MVDLESVYHEAKERGILTDFSDVEDSYQLYSPPDGAMQMYVEDLAGNIIQVNWPDVGSLGEEIREEITDRGDLIS